MTDVIAHRIEREIRERTAFRAACDPPDRETLIALLALIDRDRLSMQRQDVLRLETLAERLTGVRR